MNLPFGLLRVGRQPASTGPGLSIHDGSRSNRWGVSRYSYAADRFLFATKVSEIYRIIRDGKDYIPDRSMDDGVFLALAYDIMVEDDIDYGGDNQHQVLGMLQWRAKEPNWGGLDWEEFFVQFAFAARFGDEFGTEVYGTPFTLRFSVGPVHFLGEFMAMFGHTREASEGMQALRETDPSKWVVQNQTILGFGARAILDWDFGPVTATLEFDYASGDADPRDETDLTTFNFAHDTNVGLLLFEHILAFESARSAAVGIESLGQRNSDSFPITELSTEAASTTASSCSLRSPTTPLTASTCASAP